MTETGSLIAVSKISVYSAFIQIVSSLSVYLFFTHLCTYCREALLRTALNKESLEQQVLPVDEILIVVTLHLILDSSLEVSDPLEGQLEVRLETLVGCFQTLNIHFLKRQG